MKVFVYNDDGELLGITETDAKGKFKFEKLKKDQNFVFKIEDEDDHFQLVTLDEFDQVVDKTIKNKFGQFKYASLSVCLLYTSPSPRDLSTSRMPSSA